MIVWQQPSATDVQQALVRIYERAEFTTTRTPALVKFMRDLWVDFRDWVASLWRIVLPDSRATMVDWVLWALVIAGTIWAIAHLIQSLQQSEARDGARAAGARHDARARDVAWWEAAARAAAADNRFRDAALFLYNATLLRLDKRGVLRYHPGKTPGDYRREVRAHADTRAPFDHFIRELLPVAFGARHPDAAMFDAVRARAHELGVHA